MFWQTSEHILIAERCCHELNGSDELCAKKFFSSIQFSSVAQSCPTLCNSMDYTVHGILQVRILEWVAIPFSRESSQPSDHAQVSVFQADSLTAEPPGKPKNTGVGSLSFLQRIFYTQELDQGLLHCRQILYQLSYQGSSGTREVLL